MAGVGRGGSQCRSAAPQRQGCAAVSPAVLHVRAVMSTLRERTCRVRNRLRQSCTPGSVEAVCSKAPALPVSRPAKRSLRVAAHLVAESPLAARCTGVRFSRSRYLLQPLLLLPAGATVAGRVSKPAEGQRLSTTHRVKRVSHS